MRVTHLSLSDFRNYESAEVQLAQGGTRVEIAAARQEGVVVGSRKMAALIDEGQERSGRVFNE